MVLGFMIPGWVLFQLSAPLFFFRVRIKAIEITAEKSTRSSQTVYKDLEGNEIEVNDGKTFIQICPLNAKVTIKGNNTDTNTTTNEI